MINPTATPLFKHTDCIKDPRHHNINHLLHDMLMIALYASISGEDPWIQPRFLTKVVPISHASWIF